MGRGMKGALVCIIAFAIWAPMVQAQQIPIAPPSDYEAEAGKLNFLGVRLGMTVSEALAALNTKTLPLFSGFATPVRTQRTGDDQTGVYNAEYGPTVGSNAFKEISAIALEVRWSGGRVYKMEAHNTTLDYENILSILVSSYGKPAITSEDDPDPDNDCLRYAEWDSPVDKATDVLKLVQYKPRPKYKYFIPVFIERRPTRILQMELKSRMEWKKNYEAAAADPNPANAYFRLCASQWAVANLTRAGVACEKAVAADPKRADAYFLKGSVLFAKVLDVLPFRALPGTEEAFKKYLELAPTGGHAAEAKDMLEFIKKQQ